MKIQYKLFCCLHKYAKTILGRYTDANDFPKVKKKPLKYGKNITPPIWFRFIYNSTICFDENKKGLLYAGFIHESNTWCLSSWVWTMAASIRVLCQNDKYFLLNDSVNRLISSQQECGGWVVRNDYDKQGAIPMLAPNDSAYIANNAFLSLYEDTRDERYLNIARKCADWIIETVRPDGMVYVGYNMRDKKWDKNCVIVDVGFTASLFARLVEFTNEEKYLIFLKNFISRYIELFYIPNKHGFCTSIDINNHQRGGMFGRGQAWALEGLIPSYRVLKDERIKNVINETIDNLIRLQHKNGGWSYNLTKPLLGEDCKAVSVIAKNMMDWYYVTHDDRIRLSAQKALDWCCKHTAVEGEATGGIFSFCMEGAIVQNLYSSCAFVYSSAYAIELHQMLKR